MGLLDQLWDDTVAGPRPDIGLGKLRKNQPLRSNSGKGVDGGSARSYGEGSTEETTRVTRSIMIVKPPGYGSGGSDSTPASPAGSTPPVSPFSDELKCVCQSWWNLIKSPSFVDKHISIFTRALSLPILFKRQVPLTDKNNNPKDDDDDDEKEAENDNDDVEILLSSLNMCSGNDMMIVSYQL
ncbi:hypothetical protein ACLB2K_064474 [Fragaria x ananassa]